MKEILVFIFMFQIASASDCVPAKVIATYPSDLGAGSYQRIHPEGKYILQSEMRGGNTHVQIIDIADLTEDGVVKNIIDTPMNNEVYPLPSDWSYFSSPNHGHKMHYYKLSDIMNKQKNAVPVHTDSFNEYYQSMGDLSYGQKGDKRLRVLLYTDMQMTDYVISKNGDKENFKVVKKDQACKKITNTKYPEHEGKVAKEKMKVLQNEIENLKTELWRLKIKTLTSEQEKQKLEALLREKQSEYRRLGLIYSESAVGSLSTPVLSPDGQEVFINKSGLSAIYKINPDFSCTLIETLPFYTTKGQFSHPQRGKKGSFTFVGSPVVDEGSQLGQGVYVYNRDEQTFTRISSFKPSYTYSYPGFTKDGRVVYTYESDEDIGAITVDPNQLDPKTGEPRSDAPNCIRTDNKTTKNRNSTKPSAINR